MFNRQKFHLNFVNGKKKLAGSCFRDDAGNIWLHKTKIVSFQPNGRARLYTGGWRTVSTKAYINEVLRAIGSNAYVRQHKGEWLIDSTDFNGDKLTVPFIEFIEV